MAREREGMFRGWRKREHIRGEKVRENIPGRGGEGARLRILRISYII